MGFVVVSLASTLPRTHKEQIFNWLYAKNQKTRTNVRVFSGGASSTIINFVVSFHFYLKPLEKPIK
ncbi:hypothetical protein D778_02378 [Xanthomarina gelatinilytica]|uniref:Uncharacterized protein n=1 Tax=Xanthomarina gelatinilytica TaxID=1137281 RepID=M7N1B9_9FLAO|nr:hypothetical protein D778_02378 [Xanthomarina gelatinilytica]